MRALEVCAGVGGLSYGLHRAGVEHVAACELEDYPQSILARHWPGLPLFTDMTTLRAVDLPGRVDMVAGGIPCQPFSDAGIKLGTDDPRHLWPHFLRVMLETGAGYGLIENVRGLLTTQDGRAFGSIVSEAVAEGFTVEWQTLHAGTLGAPHRRARVFIVLRRDGRWTWPGPRQVGLFGGSQSRPSAWPVCGRADRCGWWPTLWQYPKPAVWPWEAVGEMVPTPNASLQNYDEDPVVWETRRAQVQARIGNGNGIGLPLGQWARRKEPAAGKLHPRNVEWMMGWPDNWTLADGPSLLHKPPQEWRDWPVHPWTTTESEPDRRARLKGCGNGVVGPVAERIGRDLMESL